MNILSLDGEHWAHAPKKALNCIKVAYAPFGGYHMCAMQGRETHYEFSEQPNVTTMHPDVGDYTQVTHSFPYN
jgi:hypothetical protein